MAKPLHALGAVGDLILVPLSAVVRDTLWVGEIFYRTLRSGRSITHGSLRQLLHTTVLQVYFTGVQALPVAGLLAILSGIGLGWFVEETGAFDLVPQFYAVLAHYVGPGLTAAVMVSRSAAAVAVELGNMKVAGETTMLSSFGIDPFAHLALPRLLGIVIGSVALCGLVTALSLAAIFLVLKDHGAVWDIDSVLVIASESASRVFVLGLLYGLVIALIGIRHGLTLRPLYTEVPKAASRAVVQCIVLCALITGLIHWTLL